MGFAFAPGIYEALLSEKLSELLLRHPELRSVFGKVDPEEEPGSYAAFLAGAIERAGFSQVRCVGKSAVRTSEFTEGALFRAVAGKR